MGSDIFWGGVLHWRCVCMHVVCFSACVCVSQCVNECVSVFISELLESRFCSVKRNEKKGNGW